MEPALMGAILIACCFAAGVFSHEGSAKKKSQQRRHTSKKTTHDQDSEGRDA